MRQALPGSDLVGPYPLLTRSASRSHETSPPWEVESDDDEDSDYEGSGNFAVKLKPQPPPDAYDDAHPLADNYRLSFCFTLREVWLEPRHAGLGLHLLRRDADEEIGEQ